MIEFAGIRSDERFLVVEHYPSRTFPKRKYTIQSVPGRSGDIVIEESEDAFSNYNQQYGVFIDAKAPGLPQVARGLAEWLLGSPGYQRLEDSYDPDFYRMAIYAGGEEFLNYFNEYGRGTLTFNCAPKRFYKIGEREISVSSGDKIYSPSSFRNHPIVMITGNGNCTLTIHDKNGSTKNFTIKNVSGTVRIYSEEHKALNSSDVSVNANVQSDYENLYMDSESSITWNSAVTSVSIIPRWWTI